MKELIAAMRKHRELKVPVGKFVFICRRPTDEEAVGLFRAGGLSNSLIARNHVVGWENVSAADMPGGDNSDPLPFDVDVWREWCADRNDFWPPIGEACMAAYNEHAEKLRDAAKNS